jgi:hypothetical protein
MNLNNIDDFLKLLEPSSEKDFEKCTLPQDCILKKCCEKYKKKKRCKKCPDR